MTDDAVVQGDAFETFCNFSAHRGLSREELRLQFDAMARQLGSLN
jgi:hypothetical protein